MSTTHTPGPWRVMADPDHAGKHAFHDHRWIVTEGTEVEHGYYPRSWDISGGSLICQMRDGPPANARLIAAAPELLAALENIVGLWADSEQNNGLAQIMAREAQAAIARAKATA